MKKSLLLICFTILGTVALLAASSILESFVAESAGNNVLVKWRSNDESNVLRYELERSSGTGNFKKIDSKNALGKASSYSFTDEEAFMKQNPDSEEKLLVNNFYTYRIKVVQKDNSNTYSDEAIVAHKPSSVKRTWGMIKEMFR